VLGADSSQKGNLRSFRGCAHLLRKGEVLQTFVQIKGANLKKEAKKLGLDTAEYQKDYIWIVRERD
jgi:hypothetical protein